ncbi:transposable element Tc3 transposase [Trichonephila clavipes]|uniref:Transposable element Tc3 transposase n=1 Tax=Trichonephila clavipes TaxID=2585209 RepID=A0A8X7BEI3_TRICX|nr:transposable element Tc3 transposase [Trichonephila clavipes]
MTGHIYRDVILEQHVRLLRGAMGAELQFMCDNVRPHRANIVDECLQSQDITRMDWPEYLPDLNPIEHILQRAIVIMETATVVRRGRLILLEEESVDQVKEWQIFPSSKSRMANQ